MYWVIAVGIPASMRFARLDGDERCAIALAADYEPFHDLVSRHGLDVTPPAAPFDLQIARLIPELDTPMDPTLVSVFRNQWLVFMIVGLLMLVVTELGFRAGLRLFVAKDEPRKGQIGGVQAAVLGMLALLLGFTFSMAVGRYESRRELVLQEANSIGTTFLRASFLPEAHKTGVEAKLRRYVDVRLDFYNAGNDAAKIAAAEKAAAAFKVRFGHIRSPQPGKRRPPSPPHLSSR